jgi:hypothetical protein
MSLLLFFYIPIAYFFNRFYLTLKIIYNSEKRPRSNLNSFLNIIMHINYRFFYKILFDLPLWNVYLIHKITYDFLESYKNYHGDKKKNLISILTKIKYTLIGSYEKSYIYSACCSRIYFIEGKPYFNPTKNTSFYWN